MAKHAFLIEAHNNKRQLEVLLKCLDYEENDIFIHIDKKSKEKIELEDYNLEHSRIFVLESQAVFWGGYSQIEVEIRLLEKAMGTYEYERVHLISGVDLPLVSQKEMHSFFDKHNEEEFVHYDYKNEKSIYQKRMAQFHLLRDHIDRTQTMLCMLEKMLVSIQKLIGINRIKKSKIDFYKGANWFSITGKCANYVLSQKKWIEKSFKNTKCCDEVFLQTIVANSEFAEKRYYDTVEKRYGNLRLVDWNRGNPYTFRMEDYDQIMTTEHYMFARKFDERVDFDVIREIYKTINERNRRK